MINIWRNDPELIARLGAPFRQINSEVDDAWFDSYMNNRNRQVRCAIINDEQRLIGLASLTEIDYVNRSAEFHIMIGCADDRGQGAGSFAVSKMLEHAFLNMNLNRVELSVLESNTEAQSLYEKYGFRYEGTKRAAAFKNGCYVDEYTYSILREEYAQQTEALYDMSIKSCG